MFINKRKRPHRSLRKRRSTNRRARGARILERLEDRRVLAATISVSVEAPASVPEDDREQIVFNFTRDDTQGDLAVKFRLSGNAAYVDDYTVGEADRDTVWIPEQAPADGVITGTVNFFDDESTVELIVEPVEDGIIERNEDVEVTVIESDPFGPIAGAASLVIEDQPTMYFVVDASNQLGTVDIETGCIDVIGTIPSSQSVTDIAFTELGELFAITADNLLQVQIDPDSDAPVSSTMLGNHGIPRATALIDARDEDFGSDVGDLFAVGQSFLDLRRIDLERVGDQTFLQSSNLVFDIAVALDSQLLFGDYIASGDLDYDTGGDLILSARRPTDDFDSLIEIETPGSGGVIANAPEPAEDPRETFSGIQGLAFDGADSFGFAGYTMLRVNQFSRDSSRYLVTTGQPYTIGANNSATGTIVGDPADPPVVSLQPLLVDPPDFNGAPQPSSWALQRSDIVAIDVKLGADVDEVPLDAISLINLGTTFSSSPVEIALEPSDLTFTPGTDFFSIQLDPGQLPDGRYQLKLAPEITNGPEFTYTGDQTNRFFVLRGDWDGNAMVDLRDVETYAYWFGIATPDAPVYVDLNHDAVIDEADFDPFDTNFGSRLYVPGIVHVVDPSWLSRQALERAYHSAIDRLDVNGNGEVSPIDALNVLNRLGLGTPTDVDWRFDVNRDGLISPRDALRILNELALRQSPEEPEAMRTVMLPDSVSGEDEQDKSLLLESIDAAMRNGIA